MNPRKNSKFSLQRLDFRDAVSGLRKVKPEPKDLKRQKNQRSPGNRCCRAYIVP
jgi:hypothetical protein